METTPPPSGPNPSLPASPVPAGVRWRCLALGWLVGNASGGLLTALAWWVLDAASDSPLAAGIYPSLALVPVTMGMTAMWVWRRLDLGVGATALQALACTILGLGGAFWFFGEGWICLLLASPLLYAGVLAGALLGRLWFQRAGGWLRVSVFPALAAMMAGEMALRGPHPGVVTDTLVIHAPPARVWPHVIAFPEIQEPPGYWLFRLGLPYPVDTTSGGEAVGAPRECRFSGGAIFGETIARLERPRYLTFDIVRIPPDPELVGHLQPYRGEFELQDNGDGTTTLVGRTWYTLNVRPAWYFDAWTRKIFREVHLRVMRHVKALAEAAPR